MLQECFLAQDDGLDGGVVLVKGPGWGGVVEVGGRHLFGHPQ